VASFGLGYARPASPPDRLAVDTAGRIYVADWPRPGPHSHLCPRRLSARHMVGSDNGRRSPV